MIRFLVISNHTLFWYYLASNLSYLVMLVVALKTSATHQRRLESRRLNWIKDTPLAPPITIIAPAHNEESSIRVAVRNLLELDYPQLEVIVVNDGSNDRTLEEMREEFRLRLVGPCTSRKRRARRYGDCTEAKWTQDWWSWTKSQEEARQMP